MAGLYRILWLEEDYLDAFEAALRVRGYEVDRAFFLSDAVGLLDKNRYDLLLLDVMIPIEGPDVDLGFTSDNTQGGDRSGLSFYEKYRDRLVSLDLPVLVYTICGDIPDVKKSFVELGLKPENYIDKVDASNVNDLLQHVDRVLRHRAPVSDKYSEA